MATKTLMMDGQSGVVAIVSYGYGSQGSWALLYPEYYRDQVFFHSAYRYLQPDPVGASSTQVTFPQRDITYYTWSSGGCGGCFITTAVVEFMGGADDGDELTTLRKFRDEYMNAKNVDKLKWYYKNAPRIVEKLKALPNAEFIFKNMYASFIKPSVDLVKQDRLQEAEYMYALGVAYATEMAGE
jgi:hypothetical protein